MLALSKSVHSTLLPPPTLQKISKNIRSPWDCSVDRKSFLRAPAGPLNATSPLVPDIRMSLKGYHCYAAGISLLLRQHLKGICRSGITFRSARPDDKSLPGPCRRFRGVDPRFRCLKGPPSEFVYPSTRENSNSGCFLAKVLL